MQKMRAIKIKYVIFVIILGLNIPSISFAVFTPTVPVTDVEVKGEIAKVAKNQLDYQTSFDLYVAKFEDVLVGNEDESIRALLSLNPPRGQTAELFLNNRDGGIAGGAGGRKALSEEGKALVEECAVGKIVDPTTAKASNKGAWDQLIKMDILTEAERDYSTVKVNESTSISCLLQEIVEQNKLQINLQIHTLLRDYINDALASGLAQRRAGLISKANIDWAKRGNVVTTYDEEGVPLAQETFSVAGEDPEEYKRSLQRRSTESLKRKILGTESGGDSLGVCQTYKYSTARELLRTARKQDEDLMESAKDAFSCTLVNKNNPDEGLFKREEDFNEYLKDPRSAGKGPIETYMELMKNPQNTKIGLKMKIEAEKLKQNANISERIDQEYTSSGGYLATRECNPDDPTCDINTSRITSPAALNAGVIQKSVDQQFDAIQRVKTASDLAATDQGRNGTTDILTGGLQNYDTSELNPKQGVAMYIGDFVESIQNGYFDLQYGTKDWATGAMLQIYDHTMGDASAITNSISLEPIPAD